MLKATRIDSETAARLQHWFPTLDLGRVRLVQEGPVCWFVRRVLRQGAMTLSPFVFYGLARFDPGRLDALALLAHELKHVEQYQRYGHVRFLAAYLLGLARNRFRYSAQLPLEAECYALQAEVTRSLSSGLR